MNVNCPKCSKLLSIPNELVGKVVKCPCGQALKTNASQQAASDSPKMPNPDLTACAGCGASIPKNTVSCPECGSRRSGSGSPALDFNSIPTTPAPRYTPPARQVKKKTQATHRYASEFLRDAERSTANAQHTAPESDLGKTSIKLSCLSFFCFGIILAPIALVYATRALIRGESNSVSALVLAIVSLIGNLFAFTLYLYLKFLQ